MWKNHDGPSAQFVQCVHVALGALGTPPCVQVRPQPATAQRGPDQPLAQTHWRFSQTPWSLHCVWLTQKGVQVGGWNPVLHTHLPSMPGMMWSDRS